MIRFLSSVFLISFLLSGVFISDSFSQNFYFESGYTHIFSTSEKGENPLGPMGIQVGGVVGEFEKDVGGTHIRLDVGPQWKTVNGDAFRLTFGGGFTTPTFSGADLAFQTNFYFENIWSENSSKKEIDVKSIYNNGRATGISFETMFLIPMEILKGGNYVVWSMGARTTSWFKQDTKDSLQLVLKLSRTF